jgi:hypothetical protein
LVKSRSYSACCSASNGTARRSNASSSSWRLTWLRSSARKVSTATCVGLAQGAPAAPLDLSSRDLWPERRLPVYGDDLQPGISSRCRSLAIGVARTLVRRSHRAQSPGGRWKELFNDTISADLLASTGQRHMLVEVKSSSGNPSEGLVDDALRHFATWPALRPELPVEGVVLVLNHQTRLHPLDRAEEPYTRPEFVQSLKIMVRVPGRARWGAGRSFVRDGAADFRHGPIGHDLLARAARP